MNVTKTEVCVMFNQLVRHADDLGYGNICHEGWIITFNNRKRALGICSYRKKEIQVSLQFMKGCSWEMIYNTVSHEIAHAIAGPSEGHGRRWQKVHKELGGDGQRCTDAGEGRPDHSWELINSLTGDVVAKYHRKPRRKPETLQLRGQPETLGKLILARV